MRFAPRLEEVNLRNNFKHLSLTYIIQEGRSPEINHVHQNVFEIYDEKWQTKYADR